MDEWTGQGILVKEHSRTKIISSATCKLGQLDASWDGAISNTKTYDFPAESGEFAGKQGKSILFCYLKVIDSFFFVNRNLTDKSQKGEPRSILSALGDPREFGKK